MINAFHLRDLIIKSALQDLVLYSENAVSLMLFTCSVESKGAKYLKALIGPSLGIYGMLPETYNELWQNYIINKTNLALSLSLNFDCSRMPPEDRLIYDLRFATAMTRIHYARVAQSLPPGDDPIAMWEFYREHYNPDKSESLKDRAIDFYISFIKS